MAMIIASLRPLASVCGRTSHLLPMVRRSSPRKKTWVWLPFGPTVLVNESSPSSTATPSGSDVLVDAHDVGPRLGETDDVGALGVGDALADLLACFRLDDDPDVGNRLADPLAVLLELVEDAALDALRCVLVAPGPRPDAEAEHRRRRSDEHDETRDPARSKRPFPIPPHVEREGTRPAVSSRPSGVTTATTPVVESTSQTVIAHSAVAPATCTPTSSAGTSLKYWM